MITREAAGALAGLARTIRPAWDEMATLQAIYELRDRPDDQLARAVVLAAHDSAARTPKAIGFDSYWPAPLDEPVAAARTREQAAVQRRRDQTTKRLQSIADCHMCDDQGHTTTGAWCNHNPLTSEVYARGAAAARAALAAAKQPKP